MEWATSTRHMTAEHRLARAVQADVHSSPANSRLNWRPADWNGLVVSPKDEIWFLCVCHHISDAVDHIMSSTEVTWHLILTCYFQRPVTLHHYAIRVCNPPPTPASKKKLELQNIEINARTHTHIFVIRNAGEINSLIKTEAYVIKMLNTAKFQ